MDIDKRKEFLYKLGAAQCDIDVLLEYTKNVFSLCDTDVNDSFLERWNPIMQTADTDSTACAINRHIVKEKLKINFISPETLHIELFHSIGGKIPIITTGNATDFENMVKNIIYKGKDVPNIAEMGAAFAFGKLNRFIILSSKPYSNVSAKRMNLGEQEWKEKSLVIRKNHECVHYYTKRFFGSSKNNLHDELIADFCGLYEAFGEYKAEWFLKFLGLSEDSDGVHGRIKVYTQDLSHEAANVIGKLAILAANKVEKWSKSQECLQNINILRIKFLCEKDLFDICNM